MNNKQINIREVIMNSRKNNEDNSTRIQAWAHAITMNRIHNRMEKEEKKTYQLPDEVLNIVKSFMISKYRK